MLIPPLHKMEGGNLTAAGNKDFSDRPHQCRALFLAIQVPRKSNVLEALRNLESDDKHKASYLLELQV